MDALKKFINKRKTDKAFKSAGPGHKLTTDGAGGGPTSSSQASKSSGKSQQQRPAQSTNTEEKRAAAAAALARLEKSKKPETDSERFLQSRQMAFIKEQARKELEAEKKLKEAGANPPDSEPVVAKTVSRSNVDPRSFAVAGVYFTCPLIGPEVLSKSEIEDNIRNFLLEQPEDELGVTSCLLIYSCNKPVEKVNSCVETLCKYLDNIISNPSEPKFRRIRCSNKVFQEKVACALGAEQFLRAAGFRKSVMKTEQTGGQEEEFWVFHPEDEDSFIAHLTELRDTLKQTTPIKPELDRNVQVLMPAQVKQRYELPDEFFHLSLDEIRREQILKTESVERELMLRTKAMRERDELREQRMYKFGLMRVRFPDGFTLQGTFWANEKISDLYSFVRENIVVPDVEFQLVKSGGDILSEMDATLAEFKLPPSTILNFRPLHPPSSLESGEVSYLKPDILALVKPADS